MTKDSIAKDGSIEDRLTGVVGYLLPLAASAPGYPLWIGLMSIPFAAYVLFIFTRPPATVPPAIYNLFMHDAAYTAVMVGGTLSLLGSIVYMHRQRGTGLIVTGPYSIVRHPQYSCMIATTLAMTVKSYVLASLTRGPSWTSPYVMVSIWIGLLVVYVLLAAVEDIHLSHTYPDQYACYVRSTSFLFPFLPRRGLVMEATAAAVVWIVILVVWIQVDIALMIVW